MLAITLKALHHRGMECIGIFSMQSRLPSGDNLNYYFQKKAGARWSRTNKCWYIPCAKKNYELLAKVLSGKVILEVGELKEYLLQRKKNKAVVSVAGQNKSIVKPVTIKTTAVQPEKPVQQKQKPWKLSKENFEAFQKFTQQLILKSYSPSTIKTYRNEFTQFLQLIRHTPANEFSVQRLKDYLQYCHEKLKLSENTLHSRMNALKFYYENVLKKEKFFWEIPRPKKPLQLPKFFNQDEIASIIKAAANLKHKVMLMLAYSGGLRVSEVVTLKTRNIDSKRMCILIENAKGKKDRFVILSPLLLIMLREYWKAYNPKREGYLFAGQFEGEPYSTRSLQLVLNAAKQKAGIIKPGSVHALRHSFATHLLDKGTDVTMIMKLLGHNDLKTTLRYLHVTNRDMMKIISPLDSLQLG